MVTFKRRARRAALSVISAIGFSAIGAIQAQAAAVDFTDAFNGPASPHWNSFSGNWSAHDGVYDAAIPNYSPRSIATLDFNFETSSTLTIDVDLASSGDGGVLINSDGTNDNGVLLVLGGYGYGPSGGVAGGHGIYWHHIENGVLSGPLAEVPSGVFTPGEDYHVTVTALGGVYKAYVDGVLQTTYVDNTFASGQVGLYDTWGPTAFDNFHVTGSEAGVPEPATWGLMVLGFATLGAAFRGRRQAGQPG